MSFLNQGINAIESGNAKKASKLFIKAWTVFRGKKLYEKMYETTDRIVEAYVELKKPRAALTYLETKHDIMKKNKDYEGAVMTRIDTARMFATHPKGKDEALSYYQKAWSENMKFAVGGEVNDIIPKEVQDLLMSIGKSEDYIEKYMAKNFQ
ncbi:MAG: hypothetical protein GF329_08405 [Candidatus Lokiarchaeota archaeon]|nr:hypothetical protein [Candidatus Lokiarchaeota archaeon]